ncbi:right-handed parallel beta-helix repeat-containing protein [Ramlibacter sp. USB13]|uniref:Right-handed parallel beta-helix repeat-containing protein n=1 Tax=Ramlibacter cellulosilyticus TaxID=2764187 RepID=A0A923MU95_9BURK|nr:right-handed parallel beta-helix repeat-containing protein [Ramlibacter cellulosilyticus]MBC5784863.1 right-handed parallel beta-helix repeat-containing protein [Ramlibacter cellulosilyticus]
MIITRRQTLALAAAGLPNVASISSAASPEAPPLPREVLLQMANQVSVFDFLTVAQSTAVRSGRDLIDVTDAIQACLDSSAIRGRTVRFPAGTYLMGRVFVRSQTVLLMDKGVTLRKRPNGQGLLRLTHVENTHILCGGATLDGSAAESRPSHTVYFESARRCSIRDAQVLGSGPKGDCIYVGEGSQGPSEDVVIVGGSCANARRNGISVVSGRRTLIHNVEIFGAAGAPGAGIDVESNQFDRATSTEIRHCNIHDNEKYGIVVVFADGVSIHHNTVHRNGIDGIATAVGGAVFEKGVYRPNVDIRGISAFDPASGWLTLGGDAASLPLGTVVLFHTSGNGRVPTTFSSQVRWVVCEKQPGSVLRIRLGQYWQHEIKTNLSDAGAGRLDEDPGRSDVRLVCYVEGQSSNLDVSSNLVMDNARRGITIGAAVNAVVRSNYVMHGGSQQAVHISFSRNVLVEANTIESRGSTGKNAGLLALSAIQLRTMRNVIRGFPGGGIVAVGISGAVMEQDDVADCGIAANTAMHLHFSRAVNIIGAQIAPPPAGLAVVTTEVTDSIFQDILLRGSGVVANPFRVERNVVKPAAASSAPRSPAR